MGLLDWFYGTTQSPPPPPPPRPVQRARTQCASGQLAHAQADAQRRLNQSPTATNGRLPCGLPIQSEPCDLKTFTVTELRPAKKKAPWVGPSKVPPEERTHPAKFVFAAGGTSKQNPYVSGTLIEVVAGGKNENTKTTLTLAITTDLKFCRTKKHPTIRVTEPDGKVTLHQGKLSATLAVYRAARVSDTRGWLAAFPEIWAFSITPAVYRIDAEVCGVRPRGHAVRSQHTAIRVYPEDQWELELTCPPLLNGGAKRSTNRLDKSVKWSVEGGVNLPGMSASVSRESSRSPEGTESKFEASYSRNQGDSRSTHSYSYNRENGQVVHRELSTVNRDRQTGEGVAFKRDAHNAIAPMSPEWIEVLPPADDPSKFKLVLKRNDVEINALDKVMAVINGIKHISETLQSIWQAIRQFKPKIGWDFSFEFEILTGFFKASWGWKEYTDRRVFMGYALEVGIQVFKVEMKLAFGIDLTIKGYGFVLKAEGSIEASFKVKVSFERKTPDEHEFSPKKIEGESKVKLQVVCTVGSSRWVNITGGIESGFAVDGEVIKDSKGLGLAVEKILFKGMTAKGRAVVVGWLDWSGQIKLMNEKQIGGPIRLPG